MKVIVLNIWIGLQGNFAKSENFQLVVIKVHFGTVHGRIGVMEQTQQE